MKRSRPEFGRMVALSAVVTVFAAACMEEPVQPAAPSRNSDTSAPAGTKTAPPAATDAYSWIVEALPSPTQLSQVLGRQVRNGTSAPLVGDGNDLRDTVTGSRIVSGNECIGVVSFFEEAAYRDAPIRAITYDNASTATFGLSVLASDDEAATLFARFRRTWQSCDGVSMVKVDGAYQYTHTLRDVVGSNDVVSAVDDLTSNSSTGVNVTSARAVGRSQKCIAEAEVRVEDGSPPPVSSATTSAVSLVEVMLENVRHSCR
jgi:hypothetical protein